MFTMWQDLIGSDYFQNNIKDSILNIDRETAKMKLKNEIKGTYLVRKSSEKDNFAISIVYAEGVVKHCLINRESLIMCKDEKSLNNLLLASLNTIKFNGIFTKYNYVEPSNIPKMGNLS